MGVSISEFRGEYYFLSNFYSNYKLLWNFSGWFATMECVLRITRQRFKRLNAQNV